MESVRALLLLVALAALVRADIVEDLLSDNQAVRKKAAAVVRASGPEAARVAHALAQRLDGAVPRDRIAAARALGTLERYAVPALASLVEATGARQIEVRLAALDALGDIGPAAGDAVPALAAALGKGEPRARHAAAFALWKLEEAAAPAEDALAAALADAGRVAQFAAMALGNFSARKDATRVALVAALRGHENADVRSAAAEALCRMGERAGEAAPALRAALKDPAPYVRGWSCYALGEVGGDRAASVAALRPMLRDESAWVRRAACRAAGRIGESGRALEPDLLRAGGDEDSEVRLEAFQALKRLFPVNEEYRAAYGRAHREHFAEADDEGRRETLARFGNDAKRAVRELTRQLREEDGTGRAFAAWRLEDLGADAAAAIPALTAALRDAELGVRYAAFSALKAIGLPPVVKLFPLIEETDPALRYSVRTVLREHRAEIEELAKSGKPAVREAAAKVLRVLQERK